MPKKKANLVKKIPKITILYLQDFSNKSNFYIVIIQEPTKSCNSDNLEQCLQIFTSSYQKA